jgi:hypothetical protein
LIEEHKHVKDEVKKLRQELNSLQNLVNEIYFAPTMPGYITAAHDFTTLS